MNFRHFVCCCFRIIKQLHFLKRFFCKNSEKGHYFVLTCIYLILVTVNNSWILQHLSSHNFPHNRFSIIFTEFWQFFKSNVWVCPQLKKKNTLNALWRIDLDIFVNMFGIILLIGISDILNNCFIFRHTNITIST